LVEATFNVTKTVSPVSPSHTRRNGELRSSLSLSTLSTLVLVPPVEAGGGPLALYTVPSPPVVLAQKTLPLGTQCTLLTSAVAVGPLSTKTGGLGDQPLVKLPALTRLLSWTPLDASLRCPPAECCPEQFHVLEGGGDLSLSPLAAEAGWNRGERMHRGGGRVVGGRGVVCMRTPNHSDDTPHPPYDS
jgi:hypothetical protein